MLVIKTTKATQSSYKFLQSMWRHAEKRKQTVYNHTSVYITNWQSSELHTAPRVITASKEKLKCNVGKSAYLCPNSTRRARPDFVAGRVWSFLHGQDQTRQDTSVPGLWPAVWPAVSKFTTRTHGLCLRPVQTRPTDKVRTCRDWADKSTTRQSRRTCRRPARSVGLVWSGPCSGI